MSSEMSDSAAGAIYAICATIFLCILTVWNCERSQTETGVEQREKTKREQECVKSGGMLVRGDCLRCPSRK